MVSFTPARIARSAAFRLRQHRLRRRYRALEGALGFDPRAARLVAADPRGGSTWLAEVLGQLPGTATLLEPLHPLNTTFGTRLGRGVRPHIDPADDAPEAERLFEGLFAGRHLDLWTCGATTPAELEDAGRLLVKFCRANALLPWLTERFAFHDAPVHLVRHPLAVVASQLRFGAWDGPTDASLAFGPDDPRRERHGPFVEGLGSKVERLVAMWCLNNADALRVAPAEAAWITVHYEHLLLHPRRELGRIFDAWGVDPDPALWETIDQPSSTTRDATFLEGPEQQLAKWQAAFDDADLRGAQRVLDHFGVRCYSSTSPVPTTATAHTEGPA